MLRSLISIVLFLGSSVANKSYADDYLNITILHTNDVHSHYDLTRKFGTFCDNIANSSPDFANCFGGIARLKSLTDEWRKKRANVLLLDAGDQFQGTQFYKYYKGNVTLQIMNELKYDLMTIGNHEFDDGPDHLAKFFSRLNFPVVCANINVSTSPDLNKWVKPYHLFPKYKLAVVGLITPATENKSSPGPNIHFIEPIEVMQNYIDELKALGYYRIIALSHCGYEEDQLLAKHLKGLSLIIGGHSHSYLSIDPKEKGAVGPYPTIVQDKDGRNVSIVQAAAYGKYLGQIDMTIDSQGHILKFEGMPILINSSIKEDPEMTQKIHDWRKLFDELGKRMVGKATDDFDQTKCFSEQCAMGTLVTDAVLDAFVNDIKPVMLDSKNQNETSGLPNVTKYLELSTQADWNSSQPLVFINSGGIRTGISKGKIVYSDIETVLPFGNRLAIIKTNGSMITQVLEGILSKQNFITKSIITKFIQASGLRFKHDRSRSEFNRIISVEVLDKNNQYTSINPKLNYMIITLDYVAGGGDGFFAPSQIIWHMNLDVRLDTIVTKYITLQSPISPRVDR